MRAAVGDWLRTSGRNAGQSQRTQIIEIRGADGEPPYLVRFSDGRTSLVIPGPGAVIEHSEPAHAITVAVLTALAAALSGAAAAFSNPSGRLTALAAGVGLTALLVLYYAVAYAVAYTECTPAGLRVRGVAWRRFLPWERLRDIAVRDYASSPYRVGPPGPFGS